MVKCEKNKRNRIDEQTAVAPPSPYGLFLPLSFFFPPRSFPSYPPSLRPQHLWGRRSSPEEACDLRSLPARFLPFPFFFPPPRFPLPPLCYGRKGWHNRLASSSTFSLFSRAKTFFFFSPPECGPRATRYKSREVLLRRFAEDTSVSFSEPLHHSILLSSRCFPLFSSPLPPFFPLFRRSDFRRWGRNLDLEKRDWRRPLSTAPFFPFPLSSPSSPFAMAAGPQNSLEASPQGERFLGNRYDVFFLFPFFLIFSRPFFFFLRELTSRSPALTEPQKGKNGPKETWKQMTEELGRGPCDLFFFSPFLFLWESPFRSAKAAPVPLG